MSTFLTLHSNKALFAHGDLTAKTNLILGESATENKFKIDLAEGADKDTLKTSLKSTFNGTVLLGTSAKLTATGGVDVKSTLTVKHGDAAKLTISPESDAVDAFDLNLKATFQKTLKVNEQTTLAGLTAAHCGVDSVTASGLIDSATLSTTGIADFGGLATAKAGMTVQSALLLAEKGMTVASTGVFKAAGNSELRGVVNYAPDDDQANLKFILDHRGIGAANYGLMCNMKSHFTEPLEADALKVNGTSTLDGINATSLETTGGITVGSKVTSQTLQVTGAAQVSGSLTVDGDIIVNGSMTTVESKEVNIGDNHIYLNADKTVVGETDAGIVTNCEVSKTYRVKYPDAGVATFVFLAADGIDLTGDVIAVGSLVQVTGFKDKNAHLNGVHAIESADNAAKAYRLERANEAGSPIAFLNRADVRVAGISAEDLAEVRASLVSVGHLMFCADHKTVKFAYGSNRSDFVTGDDHGAAVGTGGSYTDLINGDVKHTYSETGGGGTDVPIATNVTQVTGQFTATEGLVLPSDAPNGSEYKVINSSGSPVKVKGLMYNDDSSAEVHGSMVFTKGKDKWHIV